MTTQASFPRFALVAGATGSLGRRVVAALRGRGVRVRLLSRRDSTTEALGGDGGIEGVRGDVLSPATLAGCCNDVDAVYSCVGASLDLYAWRDRASYSRVDAEGNIALAREAARAGVRRFAYVSVFATAGIEGTAYVRAHRAVEEALAFEGFERRILRPTGFYGFYDELVRLALRGLVPVVGDGKARTNPVDEGDLAAIVAGAFDSDVEVLEVGGPETWSRAEIASMAAAAAGGRVRFVRSPPAAWRLASRALRGIQPRLSELLEFAEAVSTHDAVAPARGTRLLGDYFREASARLR